MSRLLAMLATLALAAPAPAQEMVIESGERKVALLELYTSEGCSSCPPADRWFSTLNGDPRLWREVVPVAFHVDYWDYIGWKDRFASPLYGERQRQLAREGSVRTVYTPGLVVNGEEWRGWFSRPQLRVEPGPRVGRLRLEVEGERVRLDFLPAIGGLATLDAHVALLGFDIETEVEAGENDGRRLQHDFVVLGYHRAAMRREDEGYRVALALPTPVAASTRRALAAWINVAGSLRPLQAVGGWLAAD